VLCGVCCVCCVVCVVWCVLCVVWCVVCGVCCVLCVVCCHQYTVLYKIETCLTQTYMFLMPVLKALIFSETVYETGCL